MCPLGDIKNTKKRFQLLNLQFQMDEPNETIPDNSQSVSLFLISNVIRQLVTIRKSNIIIYIALSNAK